MILSFPNQSQRTSIDPVQLEYETSQIIYINSFNVIVSWDFEHVISDTFNCNH